MNSSSIRFHAAACIEFGDFDDTLLFLEPRELADGGLICSVMERNSPFEGGALAVGRPEALPVVEESADALGREDRDRDEGQPQDH